MAEEEKAAGFKGEENQQTNQERKQKDLKIKKRSPAELIAVYEEKGLDTTEATHRVISELQSMVSVLLSRVDLINKTHRSKSSPYGSARGEFLNKRLSALETKLDEKPGIGQSFAIAIGSSAFVSATPHVIKGVLDIWSSFRNSVH